jgi:hypothetical protein
MLRIGWALFLLPLLGCGPVTKENPAEASLLFDKAKALIESNCADCPRHSQVELEEGIRLALKARDSGYENRAAVLRLLVDGYATIGFLVFKPGDPRQDEAVRQSSEFLKQLAEAAPTDPDIQFELVHRKVGNVETMADIDERIPRLRKILAIDPTYEKARFTLAQDLFQKGEDDEAIALMRGLVGSRDPERARASAQSLQQFLAGRKTQVVAPVQFSGEVSRGQNFEREFGAGLLFQLGALDEEGWHIQIHARSSPADEYSWVMTPPYHFGNVRYLDLSYGQTAAQIVDKHPRGFQFVRNKADYDRARANVEVLLGHVDMPDPKAFEAARERALEDMEAVPYCTGFFRVLDSRLARNAKGIEVVDWMKFEVTLCSKQRR